MNILNDNSIASAVNINMKHVSNPDAAKLRPEKVICIGQGATGNTAKVNKLVYSSNADDIGTTYGFGSPLHRMAKKLFPKAGNGSNVDTYFLQVEAPTGGNAEIKTATVTGTASKTFNGIIKYRDLVFEAAADVAGKVATSTNNNPAQDTRKMDLNIFETNKIYFAVSKGMTAAEIAATIAECLAQDIEKPFNVTVENGVLTLTAKWVGSDSAFEIEFVDENDNTIATATHGIKIEIARTTESAGVGTISDAALALIDEETMVTRVAVQYATSTVLDKLKEKFNAFHDGLKSQYVLCYSAIIAPEKDTTGKWDTETLKTNADLRKDDYVNVQIVADYPGRLQKLEYKERDRLLKSGIPNLILKSNGTWQIGDLCTFYHPENEQNPAYRFDRTVTLAGNITYIIRQIFEGEEWKSVIFVDGSEPTTNPAAKTLKDVRAAVNKVIGVLGRNAILTNVQESQKLTTVRFNAVNPDRIDILNKLFYSNCGRIYNFENLTSFNYK